MNVSHKGIIYVVLQLNVEKYEKVNILLVQVKQLKAYFWATKKDSWATVCD